MDHSHELKPCPHCGAGAWMDVRCYVRCEDQKNCGNESPLFNTTQEAADWWNRRNPAIQNWPEYDQDIPKTFDAYLAELVGWDRRHHWARLPATFRWHEVWDRIGAAIAKRTEKPAIFPIA